VRNVELRNKLTHKSANGAKSGKDSKKIFMIIINRNLQKISLRHTMIKVNDTVCKIQIFGEKISTF
jgi:hypothetical protein